MEGKEAALGRMQRASSETAPSPNFKDGEIEAGREKEEKKDVWDQQTEMPPLLKCIS